MRRAPPRARAVGGTDDRTPASVVVRRARPARGTTPAGERAILPDRTVPGISRRAWSPRRATRSWASRRRTSVRHRERPELPDPPAEAGPRPNCGWWPCRARTPSPGIALVLAGVAAAVSLLLPWRQGSRETGATLTRRRPRRRRLRVERPRPHRLLGAAGDRDRRGAAAPARHAAVPARRGRTGSSGCWRSRGARGHAGVLAGGTGRVARRPAGPGPVVRRRRGRARGPRRPEGDAHRSADQAHAAASRPAVRPAVPDSPVQPRRLVMIRHAQAAGAPVDRDRPLTAQGPATPRRSGPGSKHGGFVPDRVVVSPALRARQTWEQAAASVVPDGRRRSTSGSTRTPSRRCSRSIADTSEDVQTLVVVGHNPSVGRARLRPRRRRGRSGRPAEPAGRVPDRRRRRVRGRWHVRRARAGAATLSALRGAGRLIRGAVRTLSPCVRRRPAG